MVTILFLAANPSDATKLSLEKECREIKSALRQSEFRDKFRFEQHGAVRVEDLHRLLLEHKPTIVHFSGHGSEFSELILEDNNGLSFPVTARALRTLFSTFKDNIRLIVLNACYSDSQARAIAEDVGCVIGMSKAIGDNAAIHFSTALYQALGYGCDVQTAFNAGCNQIDLANLGEQESPRLIANKSDSAKIKFVEGSILIPPRRDLPQSIITFATSRRIKKVIAFIFFVALVYS